MLSVEWWPFCSGLNMLNIGIKIRWKHSKLYIDGLAQDSSISIANTLQILQSSTKPAGFTSESNMGLIYMYVYAGNEDHMLWDGHQLYMRR